MDSSLSSNMALVDYAPIAAGILHVVSRKLLLYKLLWDKSCRGVSLITQELYLLIYVTRYLDLLYLYTGLWDTIVKILHICVAAAIVLIMRYHPRVASSYDADIDTVPRTLLIAPTFMLALVYNKVALVMEVLHTFSWYLEAVVLIPQFMLLYKREKYELWVLTFTVCAGGEALVRNSPMLEEWRDMAVDNPYGLYAGLAQATILCLGLLLLLIQRIQSQSRQGLNESEKPAFDEVWEASKFKFDDPEQGRGSTAKATGAS